MIVDGLTLWKRNVDKKFEGVEECMICFSVVHGTNYQLPTIICRVCKKRFHSACLVGYLCRIVLSLDAIKFLWPSTEGFS